MCTRALAFALLALPSLALAQADSVQIGGAKLVLGMSEADVVRAVGPWLTLQRESDRAPAWATYVESHGVHEVLVAASSPLVPKAWLTFEGGKLTRVSRLLGDFRPGDTQSLVAALVTALEGLGAASSVNAKVQTTSWSDGKIQARFIDFRVGQKQVHVSNHGQLVQVVENLGRDDIPDVRLPR